MVDPTDVTRSRFAGAPTCAGAPVVPADTAPDAQRVRFDILRRMSFAQKAEQMSELSETLRDSMIAGVRFRHPEYAPAEARWAVVRHLLGDELFTAAFPDAPHRQL